MQNSVNSITSSYFFARSAFHAFVVNLDDVSLASSSFLALLDAGDWAYATAEMQTSENRSRFFIIVSESQ